MPLDFNKKANNKKAYTVVRYAEPEISWKLILKIALFQKVCIIPYCMNLLVK